MATGRAKAGAGPVVWRGIHELTIVVTCLLILGCDVSSNTVQSGDSHAADVTGRAIAVRLGEQAKSLAARDPSRLKLDAQPAGLDFVPLLEGLSWAGAGVVLGDPGVWVGAGVVCFFAATAILTF